VITKESFKDWCKNLLKTETRIRKVETYIDGKLADTDFLCEKRWPLGICWEPLYRSLPPLCVHPTLEEAKRNIDDFISSVGYKSYIIKYPDKSEGLYDKQ